MSVRSFQGALCDLIASPDLCRAVRADPDGTLARYELTERERRRLEAAVWQRGMSTNCSLYRTNRITPIYTLLYYTCRSLGDQFQTLIDEFWDEYGYQDGQFQGEIERFGAFLRERITAGAIARPFTEELLAFELAKNALEFTPRREVLRELAQLTPPGDDTPCRVHPLARLVRFRHDPVVLMDAAVEGRLPPDLPAVDAVVVLSVIDGPMTVTQLGQITLDVVLLDPPTGAALRGARPLTPRLAPELAEAGLLVPVIVDPAVSPSRQRSSLAPAAL